MHKNIFVCFLEGTDRVKDILYICLLKLPVVTKIIILLLLSLLAKTQDGSRKHKQDIRIEQRLPMGR